jgi:hypothetical protein
MKTVLIGNGYWGNIVKPKLNEISDLICVADSKTNLDELLFRPDIDMVFVCTPTYTHYDIVYKCIQHHKDVFCEKPFTGDLNTAQKLYELADSNGVNIFVDNIFLYRSEILIDIYEPIKNYEFIWFKNDVNFSESLLDSLLYHDLYLLLKLTHSNDWIPLITHFNDYELYVKLINGESVVVFNYNRSFKGGKIKKIILDEKIIDLSNPTEDPLLSILKSIVNNNVDYLDNRLITLNTLTLLDKIKKN